jgi:signal transduction histidine kinase
MNLLSKRDRFKYVAAIVWLALTVSFALWWMVLGLQLSRRAPTGTGPESLPSTTVHRMLLSEGSVFIALLVGGGVALLIGIHREHKRRRAVETFFMAFTHDLKTALASLQLQAESLQEAWPGAADSPSMTRLVTDVTRLQLQLENSLHVAQPGGAVFLEHLDLRQAIDRLTFDFPSLALTQEGDALVQADARALNAVLRNLLQNACVHGGATQVTVRVEPEAGGVIRVAVTDTGRGLPAPAIAALGQPFVRHGVTGGTGVGLFVSRTLMTSMHGRLSFGAPAPESGFTVRLEFQKARA